MSASSPQLTKDATRTDMRIGELARATGTTPRMLRYYEQQGLLRPHRASEGHSQGHRRYDADSLATVSHIRALLAAGVPTSLVHDLLPCVRGPGPRLQQCAAPVLREHLDRVREQITALRHAEERLVDVIETSLG